MRIQAGDTINGRRRYPSENGYLAYKPRNSRTIKAQNMRNFNYEETYVFDASFSGDVVFNSFLNPRLTVSQENDLGFVNAFPNFHGMYTETSQFYSPFLFPNDTRSILNVPNSGE